MSNYTTLEVEMEGPLVWLTLNRPESLNAMNIVLVDELRECLTDLATRKEARIVILRGAGRAFCAGLDLGCLLYTSDAADE